MNIFKKNNLQISLNDLFSIDWRNGDYTPDQKEIFNSLIEFFYFTQNKENFIVLDKIYEIIKNNEDKIRLNFIDGKSFYITIFIFKSFLHYSPIYISNFGEFKNSDKLLDYCSEMYKSYCIFYDLDFDNKKKIRGMFYTCYHALISFKVIEEKKIKKNKFLSKYWKINIKKKIEYDYRNFKISYIPFKIKKKNDLTYLTGCFFWNTYDIYSKNFYSDTKFNITKEEYIDLLIKRYLYIDTSLFEWIRENNQDHLEDLEILNEKLVSMSSVENWNVDKKKNLQIIQKKYSQKIRNIILKNFLNINFNEKDKIYFPFYFDFRGRKYYNSVIGPTHNKILRYVYHYGWYEKDDFSSIIKVKRIIFFKEIIKNFCDKNSFEYNEIFLESYYWLLIGIGKHGINKSDVEIKDEKIIEKGIYIIENNNLEKFDIDDKIEIIHYKKIMEDLKTNALSEIKKRIISKDGTASVYQISMLLLKPKNQDCLKWVNLNNEDSWVDTYSYIIKKFKENSKINKEILDIFNRKTTKKILMTIPYSIGYESAYEYFIESLEENNIEYKEIASLKKIFANFYNFVKNNVENKYLYETTTKKYTEKIMNNYLEKRSIPITSDTGKTDLSYKKMERKTIDLIFETKINEKIIKERITKLIMVPSKSIDYNQTNLSLGANLRHFHEADLLRMTEISLNYSINSIHDAELIDFNSCSKLILIKNRIYKELLPEYEIGSNFIII